MSMKSLQIISVFTDKFDFIFTGNHKHDSLLYSVI